MKTGSTSSPGRRRTHWLAVCAVAIGLGVGSIAGTGVSLADADLPPNVSGGHPDSVLLQQIQATTGKTGKTINEMRGLGAGNRSGL